MVIRLILLMQENMLLPGIFAFDTAVWVMPDNALVIADLHLGIEEMYNRQGVLLPRFNFSEIKKALEERIFPHVQPETIIINGDLKHEFGGISEQEWREVTEILELLEKRCQKILLIQGNHDKILGPIAGRKNIAVEKEGVLLEGSLAFVTHGERVPQSPAFKKAKTVIIGHEHPAISLRERYKREQFKCFLVGKCGRKSLVVQPSMCAASTGSDVRESRLLSPFLEKGASDFTAFAVADRIYNFGKIRGLE
jgi:hypothetical protein